MQQTLRAVASFGPQPRHEKSRADARLFTWLELGDGNITFADELDFDPSELDIVYEDIENRKS